MADERPADALPRSRALKHPDWTPEEARIMAKRGGHASKGKPKLMRRVARKYVFAADPDNPEFSRALGLVAALVRKGMDGDVSAINTLVGLVDPPRAKHVEHRHSLARSLVIAPDDDVRALPAAEQVQLPSGEPPSIP